MEMVWTRAKILQELRRLHKAGCDLSYNGLARENQSLVSAAAYHCGGYKRAVEQAGITYASVLRRPRWTKLQIIKLIKEAKRKGGNLHWSAATRGGDELAKAAFAAIQPRLFGRWDKALQAAGLDADDVALYRKWDKDSIVYEMRSRSRDRKPLNSGAIQTEDPGLHAAAVRHFGDYDGAIKAAKLDPLKVRIRQRWSKPLVIAAIKAAKRGGERLSDSSIRRRSPALYGAAVRLFGSFTAARAAAGVRYKRG
jgi:hypothetical protein